MAIVFSVGVCGHGFDSTCVAMVLTLVMWPCFSVWLGGYGFLVFVHGSFIVETRVERKMFFLHLCI